MPLLMAMARALVGGLPVKLPNHASGPAVFARFVVGETLGVTASLAAEWHVPASDVRCQVHASLSMYVSAPVCVHRAC